MRVRHFAFTLTALLYLSVPVGAWLVFETNFRTFVGACLAWYGVVELRLNGGFEAHEDEGFDLYQLDPDDEDIIINDQKLRERGL